MAKPWHGRKPPTHCDICKNKLVKVFVDGATIFGPWGIMCKECHKRVGVGLGTGRGQEYTLPDFEDNPSGGYKRVKNFKFDIIIPRIIIGNINYGVPFDIDWATGSKLDVVIQQSNLLAVFRTKRASVDPDTDLDSEVKVISFISWRIPPSVPASRFPLAVSWDWFLVFRSDNLRTTNQFLKEPLRTDDMHRLEQILPDPKQLMRISVYTLLDNIDTFISTHDFADRA